MKQVGRQAIARDTQVKSMLLRGINAHRAGDRVRAERTYRSVLQLDPKNPDALNMMGTLALDAGKTAAATKLFKDAVKHAPRQPQFLMNLANAQLFGDKPELAKKTIHKSIKMLSSSPRPWVILGRIEIALGQDRLALAAFDKAVGLDPDNLVLAMERADILVAMGHMDDAAPIYRAAIAADVRKVVAMISLGFASKFAPDDPIPDQMVALLETDDLPPKARRALRYAVGKALVDQGKYDAGFAQFQASKHEYPQDFVLERHLAQFTKMKDHFSADFIASKQPCGHSSARPIFVIGMPRSGTTLTEQILASHPQIAGAGELPDIRLMAIELGFGDADPDLFFRSVAALTESQIRKLAARYLATLKRHGRDEAHIIDKMPHNFELLGFIAILFPNAKIIHCVRDPMDTCVSCFTQLFTTGHGYNADLTTLGQYYCGYADLMAHWKSVLPGRIYDWHYEDVVNDQHAASRALVASTGQPWDDACLSFHQTKRLVHTPSRWQVRQPIYTTSLQGWKKYASHLSPLRAALGALAPDGRAS